MPSRLYMLQTLQYRRSLRLTQKSTSQALTHSPQALAHATEDPVAKGYGKSPKPMARRLRSTFLSTLRSLSQGGEQHMVQQTEDTPGVFLLLSSCSRSCSLLYNIIPFSKKQNSIFSKAHMTIWNQNISSSFTADSCHETKFWPMRCKRLCHKGLWRRFLKGVGWEEWSFVLTCWCLLLSWNVNVVIGLPSTGFPATILGPCSKPEGRSGL